LNTSVQGQGPTLRAKVKDSKFVLEAKDNNNTGNSINNIYDDNNQR